jgi:Tfp pilus assembly protein PilX
MSSIKRERGATLIVALVFLVMLALFGLSAYQTSMTDQKSSGNMQARNEALNAAQQAIETTISTPQFVSTPANALPTPNPLITQPSPCGTANVFCSDHDNDGVGDYIVRLQPAPSCVASAIIKVIDLNIANAEDLGCAVGQVQQFGIAGAAVGDSLCANTTWNVTAEAAATTSGAKVTISQGVGIRVGIDDLTGTCL